MKTAWKIGILTAAGISIGALAKARSTERDCGCTNSLGETKKVIGENEDSFSSEELLTLKSGFAQRLVARRAQFLKDLARWGTKEGIIDVSDMLDTDLLLQKLIAIREGRLKSLGKPGHLKVLDKYIRDLKRWGTKEGVIDVSNDEAVPKKKKALQKRISRQGKSVTKRYLKAKKKEYQRQGKRVDSKKDLLKILAKDYEVTQVTIRNNSPEERQVSLWEANRSVTVSAPKPEDVEDHKVVQEAIVGNTVHPQGMAVNPANGLTYVANQLSDNVSILGTEGQLIRLIQLEPSGFPGLNSPVDVAVNTVEESASYGHVYVIGSVANTLSIIDLEFQIIQTIEVGVRPLYISFNPINEKIYISNYAQDTLSIIDVNSLDQVIVPTGKNPLGIVINTETGEAFVANTSDNSIQVIDPDDQQVALIENVGHQPTNLTYHPELQKLFVVSTGSDEVIPISSTDYTIQPAIPVGKDPYEILFNPNNGFIYVGNRKDETVSVISQNGEVVANLSLGAINNGLAINQTSNLLFASSTSNNQINIIGYAEQTSSVEIDSDFEEKRKDFQHNPVVVKHAKFILSGDERFNVLSLREGNATGNSSIRTISFSDYRSPRNVQNISEVNGLEGAVIDGSNGWDFTVAPNQTITMMVYYRQFDMYNLLPETSRKSVGAEMSKGTAKALKDPNSNYNPII